MNWSESLAIGDTVSYRNVNQWFRRGKLVAFGRGPHGGDCWVEWANGPRSEECSFNLYSWREQPNAQNVVCYQHVRWRL